ncbi:sensor histidine kinase [Rhizosphaericola mali]|uniref:Histidine kinase n=1 Tax=Rhizosphaericola mali TaxID=2545455 RepID=A0A5P2FZF4_9BACT|nr:histidine kinase [Rhizosphaericola mali]QES87778.1 histidine kinase [Rhizosphaericola mali]
MKKQNVILLHVIFWLLSWFIPMMYYGDFHVISRNSILLGISGIFLKAVVFYIHYLILLPYFFQTKRYGIYIFSVLVLIELFTILRFLVEEKLYLHLFGFSNYFGNYSIKFYVWDNIYYGSFSLLPSYIIWSIVNNFNLEKDKKDLLLEKEQAELQFLKTQINPHFLFNTLNNIYALVYHNSEKALPAILKLSELMRYVARDSNGEELVPLQQEINYIESFIDLESLRIKPKAEIDYQVEGNAEHIKIAPLLLIHFVENGFKHGIVNNPQSPLQIHIKIFENRIQLHTENLKNMHQKPDGKGIGMQNLQRRLDLIYPNKHQLEIIDDKENYICNLTIDCQ